MPRTKPSTWTTWEDMPIEEFRARHRKAREKASLFVAEIDEIFPGLVTLTAEQRKVAPRLRDGEHPMLLKILDVAEKKPALFESLADEDDGMNPGELETQLLRDRIEKHSLFLELGETLDPLSGKVSDTTLYLATKFREVLSAAYRIAKAHAATDRTVNGMVAPVIDFMRKGAVAAAATRAAKRAQQEG
ncbi:hypothetical protein BE11_48390 [Sorangium cellulosum]|nr:hypothetical protein BE11_48390 [Sorangium cellulosum]